MHPNVFRAFAALFMAVGCLQPATAQDYPAKPLQLIVPFPPGGGVDSMSRSFAVALGKHFNQQVIVQNRPGGGETLGISAMVQAPADGYTLLFSPNTPMVVQPHRMKNLPYSRDAVAPLCQTMENIFFVAAGPKSPLDSFQDLLDHAAKNPGKLRYSTAGVGSAPHIAGAELWMKARVQLLDIPYSSEALALPHLLNGEVDLGVVTQRLVAVYKLKPLAVFSAERMRHFPDVPTTAELGHPVIGLGYSGLFIRKDTPPSIGARLETACREATADASYRALAEKQFLSSVYLDRAGFTARLEKDHGEIGKLLPLLKLPE